MEEQIIGLLRALLTSPKQGSLNPESAYQEKPTLALPDD
jgi:hypothetical protein